MTDYDAGLLTGIALGCGVTALGYLLGVWVLRRVADMQIIRQFTRRK